MISVWPFSSQRWSRDFGRRSGELESCCTHCYATVRRVRHTVSPRPERSHSRRAENSTTSPSSSGFWSMPSYASFFLLLSSLSSPLLNSKQGFANSTAPRGRHTNQLIYLALMNVGGMWFALHAVTKSTSVVFYVCPPSVLLLPFIINGLHMPCFDLVTSLSCPHTFLNWSPHTSLLLCLSYRKKRREEDERGTHPICSRQKPMSWEKENVFFVRESP